MKSGERAATRDTRPVIALAALTGLALLVSRNNPNSNGMAPDLPASRHPPEKQDDVAVPSPPQLFFCDESLCTSAHGDCCAPTHGQCDDSLCTSAGGDCCAPNGEEATCSGGFVPVRTYETCQNWIGGAYKCCSGEEATCSGGFVPVRTGNDCQNYFEGEYTCCSTTAPPYPPPCAYPAPPPGAWQRTPYPCPPPPPAPPLPPSVPLSCANCYVIRRGFLFGVEPCVLAGPDDEGKHEGICYASNRPGENGPTSACTPDPGQATLAQYGCLPRPPAAPPAPPAPPPAPFAQTLKYAPLCQNSVFYSTQCNLSALAIGLIVGAACIGGIVTLILVVIACKCALRDKAAAAPKAASAATPAASGRASACSTTQRMTAAST